VVEMGAEIWLRLLLGELSWEACVANGSITASGERSNLGSLFPLV
jgi:hypothetical protein